MRGTGFRACAALALAAAGLTGACGGSSTTTSAGDFQAEANQVCRDAQGQFDRILRASPRTADQAEKQAAALEDVSKQALDNLHQITPPDEVKAAYGRYLDARQKAIDDIESARAAAADSNGDAYAAAKRKVATGQATRRQLALAAGLKSCSLPSVSLGKSSG